MFLLCFFCKSGLSPFSLLNDHGERHIDHAVELNQLVSIDPGDGGGMSIRLPVTASDLRPTSETALSAYRNLSCGSFFDTAGWQVGVFGHFFRMTTTKIVQYNGVYSNLFDYYGKEALEAGDVYVGTNTTSSYSYTNSEAVSFGGEVNIKIVSAVQANTTYQSVSGSAKATIKSGMHYNYSNSSTYSTTYQTSFSSGMRLGIESAPYCPSGYAMSLGLVGTYYVITVVTREYIRWWFGDSPSANSWDTTQQFVISNEGTMAKEYVYQENGNSEDFYFLKA